MQHKLVVSIVALTLAVGLSAAASVASPLTSPAAGIGAGQQTGRFDAARPFGTLREQAAIQQAWVKERLEVNLPKIMRQQGVDMWVVSMREYNEDPVFRALVSPTSFAARRRTIYVFFDHGPEKGVERLALGGGSQGGLYEAYRTNVTTERGEQAELWGAGQWRLLTQLVKERDPQVIAVNIDHEHNFADGLTAGEWEQMARGPGPRVRRRVVRNPRLAIDYLAMRVPSMTPVYRRLQAIVHEVISAAFSNLVIEPGVTTTADVVWWMRQRVNDMGLHTWFQPSVSIQRRGVTGLELARSPVIQRGDVLHCDFGITAMRLNTDTQHMAYVLREGETEAPAGLQAALDNAKRLQDLLLEETEVGSQRQRGPPRRARAHERRGTQRHHVHASDWRPWSRRRPADRPLGLPGGCARARRRAGDPQHVVLHRAAGHHAGAGVGWSTGTNGNGRRSRSHR